MSLYLETIVELQQVMDELRDTEQKLQGIPEWMQEIHEQHAASLAEIQQLETAAETAGRERRAAEAEVADAQEKLKKYQQQINKITTQREYGALLQEIDGTKAAIKTSEEKALAALDTLEKTETDLAARRDSFRELEERYSREAERWEGEKPEISARAATLREQSAGLKGKLPRGTVAQFDRLRERLGSPLAVIRLLERPGGKGQRSWHCGACNYRVRPQVLVEVHQGEHLVQCESCKRILYLEAQPVAL